ncbi:putative phosphodiesterase [Pararobbsia alpina]|uniref:metallophosphoesterase n=1 Tax=Pararobbsia alpina TaxID=621374 RepID=UPI0039A69140
MKFQIASDLHLEQFAAFPGFRVIEPAPDADALILAGDVHSHAEAIHAFDDWPVPVIYVHGNHECWRGEYGGVIDQIRGAASHAGIHYLERTTIELGSVRILGACLWTDYLWGDHIDAAMEEATRQMHDHRVIQLGDDAWFTPESARAEHLRTREWFEAELAKPFDGKTVVVTHHGPHPDSVHPRYAGDIVNAAFVSDLTPLMQHVDLWVHGHVHDSFDYRVGACRVVVNPRGYARNRKYVDDPSQLKWENAAFNPQLVVTV